MKTNDLQPRMSYKFLQLIFSLKENKSSGEKQFNSSLHVKHKRVINKEEKEERMKSQSHRNKGRFIRPEEKSANNHHVHPWTKTNKEIERNQLKMQQQKKEWGSSRANTEAPRAEKEVAREGELDGAGAIVENQFTIFFVDGDQDPLVGELWLERG